MRFSPPGLAFSLVPFALVVSGLLGCPPAPADGDDAGPGDEGEGEEGEGEGEEGEGEGEGEGDGERVDAGPEPDPGVVGLDARPVNSTCVAVDRPLESGDLRLTQVYPDLALSAPLFVTEAPGDAEHFYAIQRGGRVVRWLKDDDGATTPEVYCDLGGEVVAGGEQGLLGIAFSPDFANNGELYLSYTAFNDNDDCAFANPDDCEFESRISRFIADEDGCNEDSEVRVLEIDDFASNHNGGQILFGPDGYLYLGMGDGGGGGDPLRASQNLGTLLGKMVRIDVDVAEAGQAYGIPADNPFRDTVDALPEIYAVGLRNPWRFSFDRGSGDLWVGDVGQGVLEEIDRVENGGNYGWSVFEGTDCFNSDNGNPRGCDAGGFIAPVVEYAHDNGRVSVTGGYVYRGSAIPDAVGTYFFADFGSREVFRIAFDNLGNASVDFVADMPGQGIASFAEDTDGELYVVDLGGNLFRLDAVPPAEPVVDPFPRLLSQTGCMDPNDTTKLASGVIPYQPAHPFYSDRAAKERGVALPEGATATIGDDGDIDLPVGTVFVKSFRLGGDLIETRLLMRHDDGEWAGYTYEWNDAGTDATLIEAGGKNKTVGAQTWTYPSRAACLSCHTAAAGRTLGWEVGQLNSGLVYPQTGRLANQLFTLSSIGVFANPPADVAGLASYPPVDLATADLTARAETYLHVNCSMCHRPNGGGQSQADMRLTTAPADRNVCNEAPGEGDFGVADARLIAPGDPAKSIVSLRMRRVGAGRMPLIGSNVVDALGTDVVDRYITSLTDCP